MGSAHSIYIHDIPCAIQVLRNAGDGDMFRSSYFSITKVYGSTLLTFTRGCGCQISRKKCYVKLEWPHITSIVYFSIISDGIPP